MTNGARRLPHGPFARAILIRGTVVWIAVRAAVLMGSGAAVGDAGPAWRLLVPAGVIGLVTLLVRLDLARLNEQLFLANLGIRTETLTTLAAAPPFVLEVALAVLDPSRIAEAITALSP